MHEHLAGHGSRSTYLNFVVPGILLMTVATVLFGKGASEVRRRRAPLRPAMAWQAPRRAALAPTGTDGAPYVS